MSLASVQENLISAGVLAAGVAGIVAIVQLLIKKSADEQLERLRATFAVEHARAREMLTRDSFVFQEIINASSPFI